MGYGYETSDKWVYKLLKGFAVQMRRNPTEGESIMWNLISNNSFGVHFRRQHIIEDYIADFICLKLKIIIEIDGGYHFSRNQIVKDAERTFWLKQNGYEVIRFSNNEVIGNTDEVISKLNQSIQQRINYLNDTTIK